MVIKLDLRIGFVITDKSMVLCSAVSIPLDRSTCFRPTLHHLADLFIPAPTRFLWEATLQLLREGHSLTFPPLFVARYSFIGPTAE